MRPLLFTYTYTAFKYGNLNSEMMRRIQQKEVEAKKQVDKAAITAVHTYIHTYIYTDEARVLFIHYPTRN